MDDDIVGSAAKYARTVPAGTGHSRLKNNDKIMENGFDPASVADVAAGIARTDLQRVIAGLYVGAIYPMFCARERV